MNREGMFGAKAVTGGVYILHFLEQRRPIIYTKHTTIPREERAL